MTSFLKSHILPTTTISSNRRLLHLPVSCKAVNKPNSPSSAIQRRTILIAIGGALHVFSPYLRRDPNHQTIHPQHPDVWPTILEMDAAEAATTDGEFPRALDRVVKAQVKRPTKERSREEKEREEEVLVIDGIEVGNNEPVKIDVLINAKDWRACGPGSNEFAGSFVHVPRKPWMPEGKVKTCLRLGITHLLERVGADRDEEVTVTLVPRAGKDVRVGGVRIEYST